ncbi:MAG: hypothetical protein R3Y24_08320 [Eubacteriales bacterium]
MNQKVLYFLLIVICMICMGIVGCKFQANSMEEEETIEYEELKTLRVSVQPYFLSTQLQYIIENQLDLKAGLKIELVLSEDGRGQIMDESIPKWDVATIGGAFVYALANDDAILIAEIIKSTESNNIYAKSNSEIFNTVGFNPTYPDVYGSPETVKGATLYITDNTTSEYVANKWLASIGMKAENVNIINAPFEQSYLNLKENPTSFASLTAPYSFMVKTEGYDVVASATQLNLPLNEVIVANKEFYSDKEDEIKIFLKLMLETAMILEEDNKLKIKTVTSWYETYGNFQENTYLNAIEEECELKEYITPYNYSYDEFGKFADGYASFLAQNGSIETDDLLNVRENMDGEIFKNALESILENKR